MSDLLPTEKCATCGAPLPLGPPCNCCHGAPPSSKTESSDSTEQYYAHMEAARNTAEAAYFDARPLLDREGTPVETFRAGFERAYQLLWNDLQSSRRETDRACQEYRELNAKYVLDMRSTPETKAPRGEERILRAGISHAIGELYKEVDEYDDESGNPPRELVFIRQLAAHLNGTLLEADQFSEKTSGDRPAKDAIESAFNRAVEQLGELFAGKQAVRETHPQTVGCERYRLTFSGARFSEVNDAMFNLGVAIRGSAPDVSVKCECRDAFGRHVPGCPASPRTPSRE